MAGFLGILSDFVALSFTRKRKRGGRKPEYPEKTPDVGAEGDRYENPIFITQPAPIKRGAGISDENKVLETLCCSSAPLTFSRVKN